MNVFSRAFSLMLVLTILSIGIVILITSHIQKLERTIDELVQSQSILTTRAERVESLNAALEGRIFDMEEEIRTLHQPVAVSGPASFPISRVLARSNDTVVGLAQREKTTADVIYALNSWLGESKDLVAGQALWIPSQ
jgi:hypothetical protein